MSQAGRSIFTWGAENLSRRRPDGTIMKSLIGRHTGGDVAHEGATESSLLVQPAARHWAFDQTSSLVVSTAFSMDGRVDGSTNRFML